MRKLLLATAALCALAASGTAYADTITYDSKSASGVNIHITSPNNISGVAGPITLFEHGVPVVTDAWCLDVNDFLAGSGTVGVLPFTLANADSGLPGVPTSLSNTQLKIIAWLIDNGDKVSDDTLKGAFQVAIWTEEYGAANFTYDSLGATFSSDVVGDLTTASSLASLSSAPISLNFLVSAAGVPTQTIVFAGGAVPEPSTWAMLGTGFGLMALLGLRRSRKDRLATF